jgi:y4mF family transcriptional regulator
MLVRSATAIGAAIRSRRRELKLDQATLAQKIGATRQWVIAVEKGKDSVELDLVLKALAALKLELDLRPMHSPTVISPMSVKLPVINVDAIVDRARKTSTRG